MFRVPEKFRLPEFSTVEDGKNGIFIVKHKDREMYVIASDGELWEHVSVSQRNRCPTWEEMCFIKDLFWEEEDRVVQYHPPKIEYVDNHPYTLHLWRPVGESVIYPPADLVGVPNKE